MENSAFTNSASAVIRKKIYSSKNGKDNTPKKELHANKISLQGLMLKQIKYNLGDDLNEYVQNMRQRLKTAGSQKARKMIYGIQKSLNNFIRKGKNQNLILTLRLLSESEREEEPENMRPKYDIFNNKMIEIENKKSSRLGDKKQKSILAQKIKKYCPIITSPRKRMRISQQKQNIFLQPVKHSEYEGKKKWQAKNKKKMIF